jgi:hypothetical protein
MEGEPNIKISQALKRLNSLYRIVSINHSRQNNLNSNKNV